MAFKNIGYRLQQLTILLLHFALLLWMYYALSEMGQWQPRNVLVHFVGMGVFGGLLIRGTAAWANYHHRSALKGKAKDESQHS